MNNFKVKDLMQKSFTENKSFLKINALNKRNEKLEKNQQFHMIECDFADKNPLDLEEKKFITLHQHLLEEIKQLCISFRDQVNPKQLDK